MLILAGVTISALAGNSGITTKAKQAKMLSEAKTEEEAIRLVVTYTNMQKNFDDENESGGYRDTALYFDGKNDYITIDGNLNVDKEITLEFYGNIEKYGQKYSFVPLFSAYFK